MSERICSEPNCTTPFTARGLCPKHYARRRRNGEFSSGVCRECGEPAYNAKSLLCNNHYQMFRRKGRTTRDRAPNGTPFINTQGYLARRDHEHPLSDSWGTLLIHREVLWRKTSGLDPQCAWCHQSLSWEEGTVCADHIDGDRANNHPFNIVASCLGCNVSRGHYLAGNETFMDAMAG